MAECITWKGLTLAALVHFSAQPERFLWDELGGVSVTKLHKRVSQVELKSGVVQGPATAY